jgi:hypothetical protein
MVPMAPTLSRRRFLSRTVLVAASMAVLASAGDYRSQGGIKDCQGPDVASVAANGDCFVFRGTYRGWPAPGVPPAGWRIA